MVFTITEISPFSTAAAAVFRQVPPSARTRVTRPIALSEEDISNQRHLTFIPRSAFIMICHQLSYDKLGKCLIMWDLVEHLAKSYDEGEKERCALNVHN